MPFMLTSNSSGWMKDELNVLQLPLLPPSSKQFTSKILCGLLNAWDLAMANTLTWFCVKTLVKRNIFGSQFSKRLQSQREQFVHILKLFKSILLAHIYFAHCIAFSGDANNFIYCNPPNSYVYIVRAFNVPWKAFVKNLIHLHIFT